jgi:hypothetical protein
MTMKLFPARSTVEKPRIETKNDVAYQALEKSRLDDLPYVEAQEELEELFDKNQLKKRIKAVFDTEDFSLFYEKKQLPEFVTSAFCLDVLIQMAIHKRTKPSALIGMLYHHFDTGGSKMAALQQCADAVEILIHKDFVDYSIGRDELVVRYEVPADVQKELDRFQYPLPMMVQPKVLKTNWDNGYVGPKTRKSLTVLKAGSATDFYSDADVCLDHLNRMNKIPLALNLEVVALIDNSWSDLDKKRPNETLEDFKRRVKAFEKYDESSKDVITALSQLRDRFWLTHKYDRRGRTYCQGYHVTYQGNPWNKAVIEFAEKEELK